MLSSTVGYASVLALLSVASAQTTYTANTNTNCATTSDVDYQKTYYYSPDDTMDWGVYTKSSGTCDAGSYARVHMTDPSGNDVDCGYVALDGNLNLVDCDNYPRGYMQEGQYTLYWETVPGAGQYSWNQFSVVHTQATVTAPTPTQSVTTTPTQIVTSTITNAPTETAYLPQTTITTPSATQVNTIVKTLPIVTTTTTTTSWYSVTVRAYTHSTTTAYKTAACTRAAITEDFVGRRNTATKSAKANVTRDYISELLSRLGFLRRRDGGKKNDVGIIGQPPTSTVTPDAVMSTVTAATVTSTITTTTNLATVTVTVANPTPTVTIYSGIAVSTTTTTAQQSTKSIIRSRLSITYITTTSTIVYTKRSITTPLCAPTAN